MNPREPSLTTPAAGRRRIIGAICAVLFLGALVLLGVWTGGWLQDRSDFSVRLDKETDLAKSAPVELLGQPIGRVRSVELLNEGGRPVIEARFWIDGAHAAWMREGAHVIVRDSLLESPWLDLVPGPADAAVIASGSRLPAELEADPLAQVLQLQPIVQNLIAQVSELIATLNGATSRIDPILAQVDAQLGTTKATLEGMAAMISDTRALFGQLQKDETRIADNLDEMLGRINDDILPGLDTTLRETRAALTTTMGGLDNTLSPLQADMPRLLAQMQEVLKNTADLTEAAAHTWPFSSYMKKKLAAEKKAQSQATTGEK